MPALSTRLADATTATILSSLPYWCRYATLLSFAFRFIFAALRCWCHCWFSLLFATSPLFFSIFRFHAAMLVLLPCHVFIRHWYAFRWWRCHVTLRFRCCHAADAAAIATLIFRRWYWYAITWLALSRLLLIISLIFAASLIRRRCRLLLFTRYGDTFTRWDMAAVCLDVLPPFAWHMMPLLLPSSQHTNTTYTTQR